MKILDAVFEKNTEKAQVLIDDYTEKTFELLSRKSQKNADRTML